MNTERNLFIDKTAYTSERDFLPQIPYRKRLKTARYSNPKDVQRVADRLSRFLQSGMGREFSREHHANLLIDVERQAANPKTRAAVTKRITRVLDKRRMASKTPTRVKSRTSERQQSVSGRKGNSKGAPKIRIGGGTDFHGLLEQLVKKKGLPSGVPKVPVRTEEVLIPNLWNKILRKDFAEAQRLITAFARKAKTRADWKQVSVGWIAMAIKNARTASTDPLGFLFLAEEAAEKAKDRELIAIIDHLQREKMP